MTSSVRAIHDYFDKHEWMRNKILKGGDIPWRMRECKLCGTRQVRVAGAWTPMDDFNNMIKRAKDLSMKLKGLEAKNELR